MSASVLLATPLIGGAAEVAADTEAQRTADLVEERGIRRIGAIGRQRRILIERVVERREQLPRALVTHRQSVPSRQTQVCRAVDRVVVDHQRFDRRVGRGRVVTRVAGSIQQMLYLPLSI